jgi:hypothetical protein
MVLALAGTAFGQETIAHVRPDAPISFGPVPGFDYRPLDLDGNGTNDFVVDTSLLMTTVLVGEQSNRFLGSFDGGGGLYTLPLASGVPITSIAPVESVWVGRGAVSACAWPFGCVGPWLGLTAYAGIEFQIGQDVHYGWIQIEHFQFSNAGKVLDWAYETRPGVAIAAGAVPEPSAATLLLLGCLFTAWLKSTKRKTLRQHEHPKAL